MRTDLPAFIETLRKNREARSESLYASDKVYALLDAYDAALQSAQAQGEGWRLVPIEPTPEMLAPYNGLNLTRLSRSLVAHVYRAMLAAAPERGGNDAG